MSDPMMTKFDLGLIYNEVEPEASQAFERLARDHGRRFAETTREWILACKLIEWNEEAIRCGLRDIRH